MTNYKKEIEIAVRSGNPPEALKALAFQLSSKGLQNEEIYDIFYEMFIDYQLHNLAREEEWVGEILDMLTGHIPGENVDESEKKQV